MTWHELFDHPTSATAYCVKDSWLKNTARRIKVIDNEPLTNLLEDFRKLCQKNFYMEKPEERMTHNSVLRIFAIALKHRKPWPRTAVDHAQPWVMPETRPTDNPTRNGQLRDEGTLAFSSAAPDEHVPPPSVAPEDVLRTFRRTEDAASSRTADTQAEHTDLESDADMEEAPIGKGKGKSKAPARRAVARRSEKPRARIIVPKASAATSQASGSHEGPPSSDEASVSQGSGSAQACNGPQLAAKETSRKSGRSKMRSMGPPPVPATRSSRSRSKASSQQSTAPSSQRRSRAVKRSRSREDEGVEDQRSGAGSSHSPKRQRTLSQPESASPKGSRKAKGKKKA